MIAIALVVAASCVGLGLWQLRRLDERRARNTAIVEATEAPTITAATAREIAALSPFRRVRFRGTYDLEGEVLLYGRALDGEPGHQVVTPLVLDDGSGVLVIRGWVPFSLADGAPVTEAPPIVARDVEVEGWLVAPETTGASRPDAEGVIHELDIVGIGARLPYAVAPFAVQLDEQEPPAPPLPRQIPLPELSEGPHLSYAIQWFSFATIAVIGSAVLLRRDRRRATSAP